MKEAHQANKITAFHVSFYYRVCLHPLNNDEVELTRRREISPLSSAGGGVTRSELVTFKLHFLMFFSLLRTTDMLSASAKTVMFCTDGKKTFLCRRGHTRHVYESLMGSWNEQFKEANKQRTKHTHSRQLISIFVLISCMRMFAYPRYRTRNRASLSPSKVSAHNVQCTFLHCITSHTAAFWRPAPSHVLYMYLCWLLLRTNNKINHSYFHAHTKNNTKKQ